MVEPGKEFYAAYQAVQDEIETLSKNRSGRFKYADIGHIMEALRPLLKKNKLSVIPKEDIGPDGSKVFLITELVHTPSGQGIDNTVPLKAFDIEDYDDQLAGKNISYMRRYSLMTLLNITLEDDASDDNGQAFRDKREYRASGSNTANDSLSGSVVTADHVKVINQALSGLGNEKWIKERILEFNKVTSLEQLPQSKYQSVLKFIVDNGKN